LSLHISEAVIWQESAGGVSLYDTETGDFRTLNSTAAQIWALVAEDGERERVVERLSLLFAGHNTALGDRIRAEVEAFIGSMVEAGLLQEKTGAEADAEAEVGAARP
jgi:Coenzyme PQQ synthesis protein D (PqqD)